MIHIKYYGKKKLPALILLHGFLGSGDDWQFAVAYFKQFFECIVVDLPGHGRSTFQEQTSQKFCTVADTIVSKIKRNRFCVLGYSMGGRIALDIVRRYPKRVEKLVCISASPGIEDEKEAERRLLKDKALLQRDFSLEIFLQKWYAQPLFIGIPEHPQYQDLIRKRQKGNILQMQKGLSLMSVGQQPNMWPWLLSYTKKNILYLYGSTDTKYAKIGKRLRGNPAIYVEAFPDCSHMLHFQRPQKFLNLVSAFLLPSMLPTSDRSSR